MESSSDLAGVLDQWSARKLRPGVVFYVAAVFAAFMAMSQFLFHSPTAVKALAGGAVAAIVQLLLGVLNKVEYQLTESGLAKRPLKEKESPPFKDVFRWDELSYVVPMKHGFKYFKTVDEPNPFRRFWKAHLSDSASGEVHLEAEDRERVLGLLARKEVAMSKPAVGRHPAEARGAAELTER